MGLHNKKSPEVFIFVINLYKFKNESISVIGYLNQKCMVAKVLTCHNACVPVLAKFSICHHLNFSLLSST